jgi:hypothetical protein
MNPARTRSGPAVMSLTLGRTANVNTRMATAAMSEFLKTRPLSLSKRSQASR